MIGTDEPIYVGIDVGSSKVCVLVGHVGPDDHMRVIGLGVVPSQGMRKGGVVSLEGVARAIEAAKDKAERTSGYEISSALVSLSGGQVSSLNSTGMAGVTGRTIGYDDVVRALDAARSIAIPYNRALVHVVPRGFVVDGQDGIKSALGMHGYRLEVEAHLVTASSTALRNLEKCVEATGITVDEWVLSSLASASVVLTDTEREMGVLVCDIGGGTTDIAIFIEGSVWHTAVLPVGGEHLTNDISQGLHLPMDTAESLKLRHGHARSAAVEPHQAMSVRPFGEGRPVQVTHGELASIIEPRIEELFLLVRQEIKRSGYDGLLPAGAVLTGGTSQLPGIREAAAEALRMPVRLARPEGLRGLVDRLGTPAFSASVGLLKWAYTQDEQQRQEGFSYGSIHLPKFSIDRAANFLRRLLPG